MAMDRTDRLGLTVAGAGHVLLIALLSLGALNVSRPQFVPRPIAVQLVGDVAPEASAPEVQASAPAAARSPAPEPQAKPVPPAPRPEPVAQPKAEPAPQPTPPVRRQVAPQPKASPAARPKPAPARQRPSPARTAPAKPSRPPVHPSAAPARSALTKPAAARAKPAAVKRSVPPASASLLGKDFLKGLPADSAGAGVKPAAQRASATVKRSIDVSIGAEIKPFWQRSAPSGVDVNKLVTIVELRLKPDGGLDGAPRCVSQSGKTASNAAQAPLHCERAIKAAQLAAPYKLPAQYYDDWKVWRVTFRTQ